MKNKCFEHRIDSVFGMKAGTRVCMFMLIFLLAIIPLAAVKTAEGVSFDLTWEADGVEQSATIVWGYMDGVTFKELDEEDVITLDTTASTISLMNSFEGYLYRDAVYSPDGDMSSGSDIEPVLKKTDTGWSCSVVTTDDDTGATTITDTPIADGSTIHVTYYKPGEPHPSGSGDENVPSPETVKTVTNNGDGTYTIQLDITGTELKEDQSHYANVLVILDATRSMDGTKWTNAKAAMSKLIETLTEGDNAANAGKIDFALVTFGRSATVVQDWTKNNAAFKATCAGINMVTTSGTNWEAGMRGGLYGVLDHYPQGESEENHDPTYVIFLTDGDPNVYYSSGADDNYTNTGTTPGYNQNANTSANRSKDEAAAIAAMAKLYGIYCGDAGTTPSGASYDRLVDVITGQGQGGQKTIAANANTIESEFKAIAETILKEMNASNVSVDDGLPSLSSVSSNVSGEAGGYEYFISTDGENFSEWEDAPGATYSSDNGVTWDLESVGALPAGTTYRIKFTVWPSQAAYDLIADLNNGIRDYDDLLPEEKAAVHFNEALNEYTLVTNTHLNTNYTFNDQEYTDIPEQLVSDEMLLPTETISLKKFWEENMLDDYGAATYRDDDGEIHTATEIDMMLTRDGADYLEVNVTSDNQWMADDIYVSCGQMTVHDGVATVIETGHDYTITEPPAFSYFWDLFAEVYHPMVINGQAFLLVLDEDAVADNVNVFEIDGKTYRKSGVGEDTINAHNFRRSNLNLTKAVNNPGNADGITGDELFDFSVTVTDQLSADGYVWFSAYDPVTKEIVKETGWVEGATAQTGNTGYWYAPSGTSLTLHIKAGWNIRFINLIHGSTFTFEEIDPASGFFSFEDIAESTQYPLIDQSTTWYTEDPENDNKVSGTIVEANNSFTITYTDKYEMTSASATKEWVNADGSTTAPENATVTYTLYQNGTATDYTVTLDGTPDETVPETAGGYESEAWKATFVKLPVKDDNDDPYTYTIAETTGYSGYTASTTAPVADGGIITNTQEVTEYTVTKEWVDNNNVGNIRPTSIQVQLQADGVNKGDPVTLNAGNNWTYTWQNLPEYIPGTSTKISYSADETAVPTGYTKQEPEIVPYTSTKIINKYSPVPVTVNPPVQKIITGRDALYNQGNFTFTITNTAAPAGVTAPMPQITSITNSPAYEISGRTGYYAFGNIVFTVPGTYTYKVTETGTVPGVQNDPSAAQGKTITFTVTDDGTGKLTVTPSADSAVFTFTNVYDANGQASITATKAIAGADWPEGKTITFTLAGTGSAPLPQTTSAVLDAEGSVTFGPIQYGLEDAGTTYTYTISENGFGDGWTGSGSITATVKVTDNGDGTLKTEVTYSPENKTITNTYKASGKATVEVTKAITGAAWPEESSITFTLSGTGGTLPNPATVTLSEAGTVSFGDITYTEADAGKTYTYNISEDGFGDGWTGSGSITATVKVIDNGDGTLKTEVSYSPENKTITNTYKAKGEANLKITKALSGANWPSGKKLTFTLSGSNGAPMPATVTAELTAAGDVNFGPIAYTEADAGKTYTYTISENGFGAGWTGSGSITATVKVTDNGDGTLKTEVTYSPESATVTNTYKAEGKATIEVTKKLSGANWPSGKKLTLTLTGSDGAPMPAQTTIVLTAAGKATFGPIAYTQADAGKTYTYTITEDGFGAGWTGSGSITATVKVTDNGNGTLKTEVTYNPSNATLTNTYKAKGEASIEVTKKLSGANWPSGKKLTLTLTGSNGAPMPAQTTIVLTAAGKATFGPIAFTEAHAGKTYTYTISENSFGAGWTGSGDVTATVKVTDNGDGTLKTTVTYSPESATITNTYKARGEATITVTKKLSGAKWPEGKTLTLTISGDGPLPKKKTIELSATGKATFGPITYTQAHAGKTYTYTITEDGFGAGWTSSGDITVTVVVTDNGDGTLSTEVTYSPKKATITNTYKAEGKATIKVTKNLSGAEWPEGKTLTLTLTGSDGAPMPETTTATLTAAGKVTFGPIPYTQADAGKTYTYTITEDSLGAGWTGSGDITVTVKITDNGDGTLKAKVTYSPKDATITNTYEATGEIVFTGTKTLEGRELTEGDVFTFEIREGDTVIATGQSDASGKITFPAIHYTLEDVGEHIYTVTETTTNGSGITVDTRTYTVTVTVEDGHDGKLIVTASDNYNALDFVNTYDASGEVTFEGLKTYGGGDLTEGQFSFTLFDADGNEIETVSNDAKGNIRFSPISYSLEDVGKTFVYTVREVIPGDSDDEIIYDDTVYTIRVTVKDNGDGTLGFNIKGKAFALNFNNTTRSTCIEFGGKKTLKKYKGKDDPLFTFVLYENGEPIAEAQSSGSGEYSFPEICYTEPGTHEYTVKEDQGDLPGMIYDQKEYVFTVTVTRGENGQLIAEISGDDPNHLDFVNKCRDRLPETGFSALHTQILPEQPKSLKYQPLSLSLAIPVISLETPIVEVPTVKNKYPVDWLGFSAGLLEDSALPGSGRSVIAGHNHLNTMEAGPFALLYLLSEGDRIFITDQSNNILIFEVYSNTKIAEDDYAGLQQIAAAYDRSLTLITCEDERQEGGYDNRRIIAARPIGD